MKKEIYSLGQISPIAESDLRQFLTLDEEKWKCHSQEAFFRESLSDIFREWGVPAFKYLQRLAVIILKPDAIVGGRLKPTLRFLREHNFEPILMKRIMFNRLSSREVWRYQTKFATLDRLAVFDLLISATESLWIVLSDLLPETEMFASARLSALKGSTHPSEQQDWQLRSILKTPNRMITFVHVPDEPTDIVREFGILFDQDERRSIVEVLHNSNFQAISSFSEEISWAESLERKEVNFDISQVLKRIKRRIDDLYEVEGATTTILDIKCCIDSSIEGVSLAWDNFKQIIQNANIEVDLWDLIIMGSYFIKHEN